MTDRSREPEKLIIRPPSEWRSLLIRVNRGCHWNRCRFCGIYPALGQPSYSPRAFPEIKNDIDYYIDRLGNTRIETVFLGDADPLHEPLDTTVETVRYLTTCFPSLKRITAYSRASTIRKIGRTGMSCLAQAGLRRLHIGLESGDAETLRFHFKGQTPRIVIDAAEILSICNIEISLYVLLGLGGRGRWKEHIDGTVEVINRICPDFIRIRRLWVFRSDNPAGPSCPLWTEIENGTFIPQNPEGTVMELHRLVSNLSVDRGEILCDHSNNYLDISGRLPSEKPALLERIDSFLALPPNARQSVYRTHAGTI
jgi:hypothetical protein